MMFERYNAFRPHENGLSFVRLLCIRRVKQPAVKKNNPPAKRGKFSGGCAVSAYEAFDVDNAASCLKLKDGAEFCGKDVFKSDVSTAAGTVCKSEAPSDDVR